MGWGGILGFEYGVVQAPLGPDISGPRLVAAVANAGGIGLLRAPDKDSPHVVKELIKQTRALTSKPFGIGVVLAFPHSGTIKAILEEKLAVMQVYWGEFSKERVAEAHAAGVKVIHQQLQQASRDSLVEGLPTVRSPTGVCEPCQLGKQHRVAFPKQASTRASAPLALVHTDLCGPMSTSSLSGLCYMLVLVDDFSRYTWVSFLKLKSEAFGSIRDWKAMVEKEKDLKVKSIRSDRGGEFLSENFARWCKSEGIRRQLTTPYTPSQNGVVERKNRTIMEMARAMLAHASLPRSYWAEACNTAVYIQNRSPTHALQDMTPFQAYYGRKPTVSHFRVFGCSDFVHIPKEKRQKLDFKSRKLLFLGYSAESDAYRLYDPDTRTTTVSRDVVFDESFITSAEGAAAQPIPILPPPSLPDPPASPVITPSTSHPVPPIQSPDVSPDHALSDSDSDLDVTDATPEVDLAPPRREKRIPGWLYSTVASSRVTELPVPPPAGLPRQTMALYLRGMTPQIQGLHMPIDGSPDLVEQEYVDDTMIFCQYDSDTLDRLQSTLFFAVLVPSGSLINWHNSSGFVVGVDDVCTWGQHQGFTWVGSVAAAEKAAAAGVDALIVQGVEAGGHVINQEGLLSLLPAVVDALRGTNIPIIAAGGIADARGYVAALALGAQGVCLGTRFVASEESNAHPLYKQRLVEASNGDTQYTTLFGRARWPGAPHRIIKTPFYYKWKDELRDDENELHQPLIGQTVVYGEEKVVSRFSGIVPNQSARGDVESMVMYAGSGVGLIKDIQPAAMVVRGLVEGAQHIIEQRLVGIVQTSTGKLDSSTMV
ncbi:hypothetical protein L7F22_031439 [Adiantum nelumboides]|nr:hypothetical protein [Adiantum nelumboides]